MLAIHKGYILFIYFRLLFVKLTVFPTIYIWISVDPLSPHDAIKHHFASLKTDFISLQPRVLERKFR